MGSAPGGKFLSCYAVTRHSRVAFSGKSQIVARREFGKDRAGPFCSSSRSAGISSVSLSIGWNLFSLVVVGWNVECLLGINLDRLDKGLSSLLLGELERGSSSKGAWVGGRDYTVTYD